ncbi:unnamed protein product [Ectocarpus fasciculatus]
MNQNIEELGSSEESWDAIDNWTEFCKEEKGELPKFQLLRRRALAAAKLRTLIHRLDFEFDRAILQFSEEDMEGYIAGGGEDAWTGYLSTARQLGKKVPQKDKEDGKLTNATARVQHMERSREMVSVFNSIVYAHDKQLKGAVLTLTKQQMDRIVRRNHENGTHKQREHGNGDGSSKQPPPKSLDHAFVTPRVKSAAKSRQAVSLLNQIVGEKDTLLKDAIQGMERKDKALLTSKNNDFLKFEAQRAKQRQEFRQTKNNRTVAEHPHATKRIRQQEARAKTTLEELKERGHKRRKALTTSVKRIPKSQRDSFVRKVSGVTKGSGKACTENALSMPVPRARRTQKNLDTTRYARAEVMGLSRRVKADVQRAIQVKDDELGKMVAMMDEEELRALADFGPTGKEDINLWKRDRRKRSWRRLSAFGMVRNDPSLYRQWAQQRCQRLASQAEGTNTDQMLGTTCATDAARRPPWSTDLHYSHRCRAQQQQPALKQQQQRQQRASIANLPVSGESNATGLGRMSRKCVHTAPSSRHSARPFAKNRPASAPSGTAERVSTRPDQPETARTPSLARLARVFYQSTVASTASTLGERSSRQRPSSIECIECLSREKPDPAESTCFQFSSQPEAHEGDASKDDSHAETATSVVQGDRNSDTLRSSDLDGAEKRMESVRLLWAVSQLSTDAVTKKIMHGYSERQRAREPNRTKWNKPSRRPQPPAGPRNSQVNGYRKEQGYSAGRRVVR